MSAVSGAIRGARRRSESPAAPSKLPLGVGAEKPDLGVVMDSVDKTACAV